MASEVPVPGIGTTASTVPSARASPAGADARPAGGSSREARGDSSCVPIHMPYSLVKRSFLSRKGTRVGRASRGQPRVAARPATSPGTRDLPRSVFELGRLFTAMIVKTLHRSQSLRILEGLAEHAGPLGGNGATGGGSPSRST